MASTLIVGIGNILLKDEGVGVHVVEAMRALELPADVELLDGGTSGADLIDFIADRPRVIIIDAVQSSQPPGTVLRMGPDDLIQERLAALSLHQLGLVETLLMARQLGCPPREVVVFGIQPADLGTGLELSPTIAAVVPRVIGLVLSELQHSHVAAR